MKDNTLTPERLRGAEGPRKRSVTVNAAAQNVAHLIYGETQAYLMPQGGMAEPQSQSNTVMAIESDSVESAQAAVAAALVRNPHA